MAFEGIALIDCEASSLRQDSYPIEVGWCLGDTGAVESHLIAPADGWTDWDPESEAVHGISRALLVCEGQSAVEVAHRMAEALGGRAVYADSPSIDGRWIGRLFEVGGLAPPAVHWFDRLLDKLVRPAVEAAGDWLAQELRRAEAQEAIIATAYAKATARAPKTHRAGDDARHLWEVLQIAKRLMEQRGSVAAR